jgi:hypothetical protein
MRHGGLLSTSWWERLTFLAVMGSVNSLDLLQERIQVRQGTRIGVQDDVPAHIAVDMIRNLTASRLMTELAGAGAVAA